MLWFKMHSTRSGQNAPLSAALRPINCRPFMFLQAFYFLLLAIVSGQAEEEPQLGFDLFTSENLQDAALSNTSIASDYVSTRCKTPITSDYVSTPCNTPSASDYVSTPCNTPSASNYVSTPCNTPIASDYISTHSGTVAHESAFYTSAFDSVVVPQDASADSSSYRGDASYTSAFDSVVVPQDASADSSSYRGDASYTAVSEDSTTFSGTVNPTASYADGEDLYDYHSYTASVTSDVVATPTDFYLLDEAYTATSSSYAASAGSGCPQIPSISAGLAARSQRTINWAQIAQDKGDKKYRERWAAMVNALISVNVIVNFENQPELCPKLERSVIDTCKRGVRTQIATCKQSLRDSIAKCKDAVRHRIDECKKKYSKWDPRKWRCEISLRPEIPACEIKRIEIPFCEFDRLTAVCCEATRPQAKALCAAGFSHAQISNQVQSVQAQCSIATALAKAVLKSYLSGQVVSLLADVKAVKEIGEGVNIVAKFERTRKEYDKWSSGLIAAGEDRLQEAQKALISLSSQLPPDIRDKVTWIKAAQDAVNRDVDVFLAKATRVTGEIKWIKSAKDTINALKSAASNIPAIQKAAKECAKVPLHITPAEYPGWAKVRSAKQVDHAVAAYEKIFSRDMHRAAKCQAVVIRANRVLGA